MKQDVHERAEDLILAKPVEGISSADDIRLQAHLETCPDCARQASATERALRSLRSVPVTVDPAMINVTRLRLHLRARDLREQQTQIAPLWISCALSWVAGVVSVPFLWRSFEWMGRRVGLPNLMWQAGFALWWVLPALGVAAMLTLRKSQTSDRPDDATKILESRTRLRGF